MLTERHVWKGGAVANRFINKLARLADLDSGDHAALVAAMGTPRRFAARHDLIREGDRPGSVFVILDGWACRYKILPSGTRQVLAFLMPGDCCDHHIALLAEMDHNIQTISPSVVATIDKTEMDLLLETRRNVAKAMYVAQLIDEGTLRAWITSMGRRNSIERVAHLMCELYLRAHAIGLPVEPSLSLPLSQLILADALGMTAVHLNRVLKTLRISGAMTLQRGCLILDNPPRLFEIAGFDENYLHRRLRTTLTYGD